MLDLPVVTISSTEVPGAWYHVGNLMEDGRVLDIMGIWESSAWVAYWEKLLNFGDAGLFARSWETDAYFKEINTLAMDYMFPPLL